MNIISRKCKLIALSVMTLVAGAFAADYSFSVDSRMNAEISPATNVKSDDTAIAGDDKVGKSFNISRARLNLATTFGEGWDGRVRFRFDQSGEKIGFDSQSGLLDYLYIGYKFNHLFNVRVGKQFSSGLYVNDIADVEIFNYSRPSYYATGNFVGARVGFTPGSHNITLYAGNSGVAYRNNLSRQKYLQFGGLGCFNFGPVNARVVANFFPETSEYQGERYLGAGVQVDIKSKASVSLEFNQLSIDDLANFKDIKDLSNSMELLTSLNITDQFRPLLNLYVESNYASGDKTNNAFGADLQLRYFPESIDGAHLSAGYAYRIDVNHTADEDKWSNNKVFFSLVTNLKFLEGSTPAKKKVMKKKVMKATSEVVVIPRKAAPRKAVVAPVVVPVPVVPAAVVVPKKAVVAPVVVPAAVVVPKKAVVAPVVVPAPVVPTAVVVPKKAVVAPVVVPTPVAPTAVVVPKKAVVVPVAVPTPVAPTAVVVPKKAVVVPVAVPTPVVPTAKVVVPAPVAPAINTAK